jgi:preprotein translocase subunit SecF
VELFRGVNIDWLRLKWAFLGFSLLFSVAGIVKMAILWSATGSPVPLGVDFRGGTEVQVQFQNAPDITAIRQAMDAAGIRDAKIQPYNTTAGPNQVLISLPEELNEGALDAGRQQVVSALHAHYANQFNDSGVKVDVVGPTVGKQLETQAWRAVLVSLLGMLVYLWFRFQLIYGVAAVVAVFHDTLITVGFFALTGQEISLTVIAAILTLVGYSMNDTIVVFDRIRENLRMSRRESLPDVVNRSINQTLSRTVLDFWTDVPDCAFAVHIWRAGSAGFFVRAGGWDIDRDLFFDRSGSANAGCVAAVAWWERRKDCVVLPAAKRAKGLTRRLFKQLHQVLEHVLQTSCVVLV